MWCGVANFSVKSDKISEMQQFLMYYYIGRLEDISFYMSISRE